MKDQPNLQAILDNYGYRMFKLVTKIEGKEAKRDYSDKSDKEAIDAIYAGLLAVISEDEFSEDVRGYKCPIDGCYTKEDYYAVTKGEIEYCSIHGKKLKYYEEKIQQGDDWERNELREAQRQALKRWCYGDDK